MTKSLPIKQAIEMVYMHALFPNQKNTTMKGRDELKRIDPNAGAASEDEGAEQTSNDQLPGASEIVD